MAIVYRVFPSGAALAAFAVLTILYLSGHHALYARVLAGWGVEPFRFPFLDASGALAAWDCTRLGIDVIAHNPCDVLDRSYNYSPLWMSLAAVPLGRTDAGPVGCTLDLLFLGSLVLLPPARRPCDLALVTLATLSSTVALAVERANMDLLVFLLALAIGFLSVRSQALRIAAYGLALAAALIKYYPLSLLVLLARERTAVLAAVLTATVVVLGAFVAGYAPEIARGIPMIPSGPYYTGFFGARNLPFLIGDLAGDLGLQSPVLTAVRTVVVATLLGVLLLAVAAICRYLLGTPAVFAARQGLNALDRNLLVIGSALIVGCFVAGQNIVYRGIFLLFVLPGLVGIARDIGAARGRRCLIGTAVVIVLLLWQEFFRLSLYGYLMRLGLPREATLGVYALFWFCRELGWWWTIAVMTWVLVDFWRNSPIALSLSTLAQTLRLRWRRA